MTDQVGIALKTCIKCKVEKSLSDFTKLSSSKSGFNSQCKVCKQKYQTEYYYSNDSKRKARIKASTGYNRKRKYGISSEQYEELLKSQNYCCAICNIRLDSTRFGLTGQVDHCHTGSKKVRGILCSQCNTGLGNFYEDEDKFLSAIKYLRRN